MITIMRSQSGVPAPAFMRRRSSAGDFLAQGRDSSIGGGILSSPVAVPFIVPPQDAPTPVREFSNKRVLAGRQTTNAILTDASCSFYRLFRKPLRFVLR